MLKIVKDMLSISKKKKEENVKRLKEQTQAEYEQSISKESTKEESLIEETSVGSHKKTVSEEMPIEFSHSACTDPMCDCGILYLKEVDKENGLIIPLNIHDKRVISPEELYNTGERPDAEIQAIAKKIEGHFSEEDWQEMREIYTEQKIEQIDQVNPNEVSYGFTIKDFEDEGLMTSYLDIFPCSPFTFEINDKQYLVTDTYCKNDICECREVHLSIFSFVDLTEDTVKEINTYEYDYKLKIGSFTSSIKEEEAQKVIDNLFLEFPNLNKTLAKRNRVIRRIFKKAKKDYWSTKNISNPEGKSISRNAPCPCGSGKKYKRCCGK